jgi:hypothetical protein
MIERQCGPNSVTRGCVAVRKVERSGGACSESA